MKQITEIRCSGLSRPMTCAGSLFFENLIQEESGQPAKEGTAAGRYLQYLLENTPIDQIPAQHENGVIYDDDIKFHANNMAHEIISESSTQVTCEQRIDWTTRSGIVIRGQPDATYVKGDTLCIDDLKYGYGIVEVKENWQLLGYAIGEVMRHGIFYEKIRMRILQPRPHHEEGPIREWTLTYTQLMEYKERIESRMDAIVAGEKQLVTSEKCKYCPAAGSACTAFNRSFYSGVDHVMNHFQQDDIDEKELAHQLSLINRIDQVMKIKKDSLTSLAVDRIKQGKIIPGYMTEDSYGDRKWKPSISPEVIQTLTGKNIIKTEMLSPAQAEKLGVPKELVSSFVDRHFLGQKLVRKDASALGNKIFSKPTT